MVADLTVDEVVARNLQLLLAGVSRQLKDLHPIAQRCRNCIHHIGGRDEQDLR